MAEIKDKVITAEAFKAFFDFLNSKKVHIDRKVNNKPLSSDITLEADDVGAIPNSDGAVELRHFQNLGADNTGKAIIVGDNGDFVLEEITAARTGALPSSGGSMSGNIDMAENRITNMSAPVDDNDAVRKSDVVLNSGGEMTGNLSIPAPTEGSHAATKQYVDEKMTFVSVMLPASDWEDNAQTVSVSGVTADTSVTVSPDPSSDDNYTAYLECGVRCTAVGNGTMTFKCNDVPSAQLTANVAVYR